MTTHTHNESSSKTNGARAPRRRARARLMAGAFALTAVASAGGVAHALIAGVQPAALVVAPPPSVGPAVITAPDIWTFNEKQDVFLPVPILLNVQPVNPGVHVPQDMNPVWIPAGTCVSSHYIFYGDAVASTVTGGVSFTRPILGAAILQAQLDLTNFLGAPPTNYPVAAACNGAGGADCGMELFPQDAIRMDPFRVQVSFEASMPGDRVRVITLGEPDKCHHIGEGGGGAGD